MGRESTGPQKKISIHAPAEGATARCRRNRTIYITISIHAPAEGATEELAELRKLKLFQSTLPRRERLGSFRRNVLFWLFQSTLPRRERHLNKAPWLSENVFQSTLPRRERRAPILFFRLSGNISIHAPAEGATYFQRGEGDFLWTFQSTLPRRERRKKPSRMQTSTQFQSTLPRRERQYAKPVRSQYPDFNPRSRGGSDSICREKTGSVRISIHAPAEGATSQMQCVILCHLISIHAPAEGATQYRSGRCKRFHISIHAPAEGATTQPELSA